MNKIQQSKWMAILQIGLWIISGTLFLTIDDILFLKIDGIVYLIMIIILLWFSYIKDKCYWELSEITDRAFEGWKISNEKLVKLMSESIKQDGGKNGNKQRSSNKSNKHKK